MKDEKLIALLSAPGFYFLYDGYKYRRKFFSFFKEIM